MSPCSECERATREWTELVFLRLEARARDATAPHCCLLGEPNVVSGARRKPGITPGAPAASKLTGVGRPEMRTAKRLNVHLPPDLSALASIVPEPRGPEIGMPKLASPRGPA